MQQIKFQENVRLISWCIVRYNFILFCLIAAVSCGRKSDPKPHDETAPRSVKGLTLSALDKAVSLKWEAPELDASGNELTDLTSFVVLRRFDLKGEQVDFDEIGIVEVAPEDQNSLSGTPKTYSLTDSSVELGKKYQYQVVAVNSEGIRGPPSRTVRLTFVGSASIVETF